MNVLNQDRGENWAVYHADCIEAMKGMAEASIHYSLHSPPFASLYTFSDDPRDLSNCQDDATFWAHYRFAIAELFRITKPGRLCSIHCMQLPTSKLRDGFIGLRDFRGMIIRAFAGDEAEALKECHSALLARALRSEFEDDIIRANHLRGLAKEIEQEMAIKSPTGFIYHSEVCIRKDPVSAMQRSKSIGLLHKQVVKDSSLSRMAVADYIVTMRKPGDNPEPIAGGFDRYYGTGDLSAEDQGILTAHIAGSYSVQVWQRYAEPIWMDIAQGDTLSRTAARDEADERHIAPLQLTVIRRCLQLWTMPNDIVLSPFAGIGSEGYCAIDMGRRFLGIELKASYYKQAVANLRDAESKVMSGRLL